jgi:hypothetical protein
MSNLTVVIAEGDSITYLSDSYFYQAFGIPSASVGGRNVGAVAWPVFPNAMPLAAQSFSYNSGADIVRNVAITGSILGGQSDNSGQLWSRGPFLVDPVYANSNAGGTGGSVIPAARRYVLTVNIGSNDTCQGGLASVSAYATAVGQYLGNRKTAASAAGYTLICGLCTVLPRNDGLSSETNRASYNSLLTSSIWRAANNTDFVIDLASEPTMGLLATCANTTWYVDGVHPTAAGAALLAPICLSSVTPYL